MISHHQISEAGIAIGDGVIQFRDIFSEMFKILCLR